MEKEENKAGIVDLCALFPFINHDNNILKDFYAFPRTKPKGQKHVILSFIWVLVLNALKDFEIKYSLIKYVSTNLY